ncbi:hypothetical protein OC835_006320 [Tilletia horrida]|nr:hypothetical protein OC835_006320 [Tilletia horrida]
MHSAPIAQADPLSALPRARAGLEEAPGSGKVGDMPDSDYSWPWSDGALDPALHGAERICSKEAAIHSAREVGSPDTALSEPAFVYFSEDVLSQLEQEAYARAQPVATHAAELQHPPDERHSSDGRARGADLLLSEPEYIDFPPDVLSQLEQDAYMRTRAGAKGTAEQQAAVRDSGEQTKSVITTCIPIEYDEGIWQRLSETTDAVDQKGKAKMGYHLPGNPHASSSPNPYGNVKDKADHGGTVANEDGSVDDAPGPAADEHNAPQSTTERLGGEAGGQGAAPESESQLYPPRPYYAFKRLRYVKDPLL